MSFHQSKMSSGKYGQIQQMQSLMTNKCIILNPAIAKAVHQPFS